MARLQSAFAISELLGSPLSIAPLPAATCWSLPPFAQTLSLPEVATLQTCAAFALPVPAAAMGPVGGPAEVPLSVSAATCPPPAGHLERAATAATSPSQTSSQAHVGRSPRIPFTRHQLLALESRFELQHYLSGADVAALSAALALPVPKVLHLERTVFVA